MTEDEIFVGGVAVQWRISDAGTEGEAVFFLGYLHIDA
jgi:hypothetical protein